MTTEQRAQREAREQRGARPRPDGSPVPDGTPAHGVPRFPDGTPAQGVPQARGGARGGHPEQREPGGGWGDFRGRAGGGPGSGPGLGVVPGRTAPTGPGAAVPRQRQAPAPGGPRQEYLDAFDAFGAPRAVGSEGDVDDDVFALRSGRPGQPGQPGRFGVGAQRTESYGPVTDPADEAGVDDDEAPTGPPAQTKGGKGRAFTGIAAAAVTTVLVVVVAGQVADGRDSAEARSQSAPDPALDPHGSAAPGVGQAPTLPGATALTYEQKMDKRYALGATFMGSGKFEAVPGADKAPGSGRKYTYRVDVERGLGLDGGLFAEAVQKTLNDGRSWAHDGARTFARVSSGRPDFVITLASPGTTAEWCAKSGLDTTEDNVSCDSASTDRVMINAYRWAQGSKTYGDAIHPYRQMLINHEVGHRLGYGHVTCDKDGELAPVMQQQTKFLDHDGIHCLPNPWPFPKR
ncbi:DUF3152 domain-containing protein [Streptomyces sp. NPDC046805]|uniref:DUF3152 domain-containing protein n=1 Tax=Streptomyces sp. NPDC046805 TaxID=3155134 RepID=UPI0033DD6EA9